MDEDEVMEATASWWDGESDQAITLLKEFLANAPRSVRARLRLAEIYSCEYGEDVPGAARLLREVLIDAPDNVWALTQLGLLQGHPGSTIGADESLAVLSKAADLTGDLWAIENLANKSWDTAHFEDALSAFQRLSTVAKSRGLKELQKRAKVSMRAIRRHQPSRTVGYSIPELK